MMGLIIGKGDRAGCRLRQQVRHEEAVIIHGKIIEANPPFGNFHLAIKPIISGSSMLSAASAAEYGMLAPPAPARGLVVLRSRMAL